MDDTTLGRRVREAREAKEMSMRTLAELIGLDSAAMSRMETGLRTLKASELVAIAEVLEMPLDALIGGPDAMERSALRVAEQTVEPFAAATVAWMLAVARWLELQLKDGGNPPAAWAVHFLNQFLPKKRAVAVPAGTAGAIRLLLAGLSEAFDITEIEGGGAD